MKRKITALCLVAAMTIQTFSSAVWALPSAEGEITADSSEQETDESLESSATEDSLTEEDSAQSREETKEEESQDSDNAESSDSQESAQAEEESTEASDPEEAEEETKDEESPAEEDANAEEEASSEESSEPEEILTEDPAEEEEPIAAMNASATSIEEGWYYIQLTGSELALDINKGTSTSAAGANADVYTYDQSKKSQLFHIIKYSDKTYYIVPYAASDLALECQSGSTNAGTNIRQYRYNGSCGQLFTFYSDGSIVTYNGKTCLTAESLTSGANLKLAAYSGKAKQTQKWTLVETSSPHSKMDTSLANGWYTLQTASNTKFALDIGNGLGYTKKNSNADVYTFDKTNTAEYFYLTLDQSTGTYTMVPYNARTFYLSLSGTNALQNATAQKFILRLDDTDGSYRIQAKGTDDLCLTAESIKNSGNVGYSAYDESKSEQKWILTKRSAPTVTYVDDLSGWYYINSDVSGYRLDIAKGQGSNEAAKADLYTEQEKGQDDSQRFYLKLVDKTNHYYTIETYVNQNMYLAAENSAYKAGTQIGQSAYTGKVGQKFRIVKNSDGTCRIISARSNACLTAASSKNGAAITLGLYSDLSTQKWSIKKINYLEGTFVLSSAISTDRAVEVAGGSTTAGANIRLNNNKAAAYQKFKIEVVNETKQVYTITNSKSGMRLTYETLASGGNVIQAKAKKTASQYWYILPNSDGTYSIRPYKNKDLALDITGSSIDYRTNIRLYKATTKNNQKWYLTGSRVSTCKLVSKNTVRITGSTTCYNGDDGKIYMVALNPVDQKYILAGSTDVLGSTSSGKSFTITSGKLSLQKYLNYEFYAAVKINGLYHIASNGYFITNPEKASTSTAVRTTPINKKGGSSDRVNSVIDDQINNLHVKNVSLNIPIMTALLGNSASFTYNGVTYKFNGGMSVYQDIIRKLNKAGVQVNVIIYADASMGTLYPDYVTPDGRNGSAAGATLVGMNAQTAAGRKKIEALFAYLASLFTSADCHIDNWVIGNELDDPVHWNYCGSTKQIDTYATMYAEVYRVAYNVIKSYWSGAEIYDSLDHVWNTTSRGSSYYTSKSFQDTFNNVLAGEGAINWGLAFHPYCVPEQDPRVWQSNAAVRNSSDTELISMQNISALTDYVDSAYGTSHHIILSETGISAKYNDTDMEDQQAAAVAYCYYAAENNSRIDSITIHNYKDASGEISGGWYLGLYTLSGTKRKAYYVMANMDSKTNGLAYTQTTKKVYWLNAKGKKKALITLINGNTAWSQIFPNLDISKFGDSRY